MMKIKSVFASMLFICSGLLLQAQQVGPAISFDEEAHNFGELEEDGGSATYKFTFVNTGSEPLILTNVRASCGCTTPSYSKEPVMPGQKGFIEVSYNPKNRPGPFNKSITVSTNASDKPVILRISGSVKMPEKPLGDVYRHNVGPLGLKRNNISVSTIAPEEIKNASVDVVNTGSVSLELKFKNVPEYIKIVAIPNHLKPGEKGVINVEYLGPKVNDWGTVNDWITLNINGDDYNKDRIAVHANVQEDFSKLSAEELANAPQISCAAKTFDFGTITQGEKVKHSFIVQNTGKSQLIIRKVTSSCGCTVVEPELTVLAPGISTRVDVHFDSKGRIGSQSKAVTIISNDPKNFRTLLWVKGQVIG